MGIVMFAAFYKAMSSIKNWIGNTFAAGWENLSNQITLLLAGFDDSQTSKYDKEIKQLPVNAVYQIPYSYFPDGNIKPLYIKDGRLYCQSFYYTEDSTTGTYKLTSRDACSYTTDFITWKFVSGNNFGLTSKSEYINGYIYNGYYKIPYGDSWNPISGSQDMQGKTSTYMIGINDQIDVSSPYTTVYDIASDGTNIVRIAKSSKTMDTGSNSHKYLYVGATEIQKSISYMLPEEDRYKTEITKYFLGTSYSTLNASNPSGSIYLAALYRTCSIAYNDYYYVQIHNLLYKLTSTYEIDSIYRLTFPVREMIVLNNYLHIITDGCVVQCNL